MKRKEEWLAFCTTLARDNAVHEDIEDALHAIAYMEIGERKELLKIARTARHPYYNIHTKNLKIADRFYKNQRSDLQYVKSLKLLTFVKLGRCLEHCKIQVREAVDKLGSFIHKDPICAAILNNACRSAPFLGLPASEADINRANSWEKEILACHGRPKGPVLDYACWFSQDEADRFRPLGEHLPSAPVHNTRINWAFREWRSSMEGAHFFPQIQTSKSMSRATAERYWVLMESKKDRATFDSNVTSAMVERAYADLGVEIQGPCEIRQIWGYNDLTPRTYFAQGGTTFHESKYIRKPFNRLSDHFHEVNFVTRSSIQDIIVQDRDIVFIYDYESFTSNLEEFRYFLAELSAFCEGTEIFLVDSREGIIRYDLGALIKEYNDTCNFNGVFMVLRYMEGDFNLYEHEKAGFLGVYGNIVGCTVLHGLHATQIDGDYSDGKCVGDDAFIRRLYHLGMVDQSEIYSRLQALGIVHPEKTTSWERNGVELQEDTNSTWPYVKRPLFRSANRMIHEPNISLPILGRLCQFIDEVRCDDEEDPYDIVKIAAIQTRSAFRQVRALLDQYPVANSSLDFLIAYFRYIYMRLGLPVEGALPFESIRCRNIEISGVLVPPLDHAVFNEDEWNLLQRRFDKADIFLQVPMTVLDEVDCLKELIQEGNATGTSSQEISYLVGMGWCQSRQKKMLASFSFDEYRRYYERIFNGDSVFMYDFELCGSPPRWLPELYVRRADSL